MKRLLSIVLALVMTMTLVHMSAFAESKAIDGLEIYQGEQKVTDGIVELSVINNPTTKLIAKDQNGNAVDIKWESENDTWLTVATDGTITAHSEGIGKDVQLTAIAEDGKTAKCKIRITIKGLEGMRQIADLEIPVGDTEIEILFREPFAVSSVKYDIVCEWLKENIMISSDNEEVVSKDDVRFNIISGFLGYQLNLYVVPHNPGDANVTLSINNDYYQWEDVFNVKTPNAIIVKQSNIALEPGETEKIDARVEPPTADSNLTFSSRDKNVATVAADGSVTGVANGKTTIDIKQTNGDLTASVPVTVVKAGFYIVEGGANNVNEMSMWIPVGDELELTTSEGIYVRYFTKDNDFGVDNRKVESSNLSVVDTSPGHCNLIPKANGTVQIRMINIDREKGVYYEVDRTTIIVNCDKFEDAKTEVRGDYVPQGENRTTLEMTGKEIETNTLNEWYYENHILDDIDMKDAEFSFTVKNGKASPIHADYLKNGILDHIKLYKKSDLKNPIASFEDEDKNLVVKSVDDSNGVKDPTSVTFSVIKDVLAYDTEYVLIFDKELELRDSALDKDAYFYFKTAPAQAIKFDKDSEQLKKGAMMQLKVLKDDEAAEAYEGEVAWASSDESVATVDENGVVTAVGRGEAEITATTTKEAGEQVAKCKVTVKPHIIGEDGVTYGWKLNDEVIEITDEMAAAGVDTQDKVIEALLEALSQEADYEINEDNSAVFDLRLMMSTDGGENWVEATDENIPEGGLYVNLGYPENIDPEEYDFTVVRMLPADKDTFKAGTVEVMDAMEVDDEDLTGLGMYVDSSAPIAVSWEKSQEDVPSELPAGIDKDDVVKNIDDEAKTGDNMNLMLLFGFMIAAAVAAGAVFFTRKSRQ